jgi:hypothetical protein
MQGELSNRHSENDEKRECMCYMGDNTRNSESKDTGEDTSHTKFINPWYDNKLDLHHCPSQVYLIHEFGL